MSGCRVIKWEGEERWAVEKNDSMFAPTFREQLPAMMFADIYQSMDWRQPDRWTDNAQEAIANDIRQFIDEKMPESERNRRNQRMVPEGWVKEIIDAGKDEDDEEAHLEVKRRIYDYDQLVEECDQQWKRGHVKVLDMVIEWFHRWQAERLAAVKAAPKAKPEMVPVKDALPGGKP